MEWKVDSDYPSLLLVDEIGNMGRVEIESKARLIENDINFDEYPELKEIESFKN